ncbi:MAG: type I-G CRISPR-associated protein Csb2 [Gemmatimonadota bacterium]
MHLAQSNSRQLERASAEARHCKLASYAVRSAVLPPLTDAIPIAECLRAALLKHADGRGDHALRVFSGHDAAGRPLTGNRHAYYLPADDDNDGRIDHLIVWAPDGFDAGAREALASLQRLWGRDSHDLDVSLTGLGDQEDCGNGPCGTGLLGPANVWESRTPFILPRHPKFRRGTWADTPEDQLRRLLADFDLHPTSVERCNGTVVSGGSLEWFRFRRERRSGSGSKASHRGYGFRLHFDKPVKGPIAVGYGAHMGLGQFIAVL